MSFRTALIVTGAAIFLLVPCSGIAADGTPPVAGLMPDQRPQGAPVITEVVRDRDWQAGALRGVTEPYPESLRFLNDQGNWFTPFNRRGMPGRYDIRHLHEPAP